MTPRKYAYVDAMRGIAILMVILVHVGQRVPGISGHTERFTALGQFGVQLFFVASALTLCLSWHARVRETLKIPAFYLRRFFRIAPMYYVGILLFTGGEAALHLIRHEPLPEGVFTGVAANILFVHGFVPAANNNIVPGGWSIGCEVIFYVIFPLLVFLCRSLKVTLVALVVWLAASSLLTKLAVGHWPVVPDDSFAYYNIGIQLPVFLVGFIVYFLLGNIGKRERIISAVLLPLSLIVVFCAHRGRIYLPGDHYLVPLLSAIGFGALAILLSSKEKFPQLLLEIGKRSFSMYLLHFIFTTRGINLVWKVIPPRFSEPAAGVVLLVLYLAIIAACYPLAGLTYRFIEKPMVIIGNRLIERLQSKQVAKASV